MYNFFHTQYNAVTGMFVCVLVFIDNCRIKTRVQPAVANNCLLTTMKMSTQQQQTQQPRHHSDHNT